MGPLDGLGAGPRASSGSASLPVTGCCSPARAARRSLAGIPPRAAVARTWAPHWKGMARVGRVGETRPRCRLSGLLGVGERRCTPSPRRQASPWGPGSMGSEVGHFARKNATEIRGPFARFRRTMTPCSRRPRKGMLSAESGVACGLGGFPASSGKGATEVSVCPGLRTDSAAPALANQCVAASA